MQDRGVLLTTPALQGGLFVYCSPSFLTQVLSWNLKLALLVTLADQKAQDPPVSAPSMGKQACMPGARL